jgi:hypothetical protein
VALDRQCFAGELVDDIKQLEDPAVGGLVELKVQRPYMIGSVPAIGGCVSLWHSSDYRSPLDRPIAPQAWHHQS